MKKIILLLAIFSAVGLSRQAAAQPVKGTAVQPRRDIIQPDMYNRQEQGRRFQPRTLDEDNQRNIRPTPRKASYETTPRQPDTSRRKPDTMRSPVPLPTPIPWPKDTIH